MSIRYFPCQNIIAEKTVKERWEAIVVFGNSFFKDAKDIVKISRFLMKNVEIFHGFIRGFGHTVGEDNFDLSDNPFDENVTSFKKNRNLALIFGLLSPRVWIITVFAK